MLRVVLVKVLALGGCVFVWAAVIGFVVEIVWGAARGGWPVGMVAALAVVSLAVVTVVGWPLYLIMRSALDL